MDRLRRWERPHLPVDAFVDKGRAGEEGARASREAGRGRLREKGMETEGRLNNSEREGGKEGNTKLSLPTRRTTRLSSKVNLPHAIDCKVLSGAHLVT